MALKLNLGNRLAPVRFLVFLVLLIAGIPILGPLLGWRHAVLVAFDIAAAIFLMATWPLLRCSNAQQMRSFAERNDANRSLLLAITAAVSLVVLVAVFSELEEKTAPKGWVITLIIATLVLAWLFSNMVYALHYAHVYYTRTDRDGDGKKREDSGGLDFPETKEPNYWDFVYFSFTLGMTFQTSDTAMTTTQMRRIATVHCLAAFVFNLGVLAFTINVLGSGGS